MTALSDDTIKDIIAAVRPYTGVPAESLELTIRLTLEAIDAGIPGDLVECGTWLGGSSFAMLLAQRHAYGEIRRPVWMYDSFEGMSPPTDPDGRHAAHWWEGTVVLPKDQASMDYCIAPFENVQEAIAALDLGEHVIVHMGWLAETLPKFKPESIAILRVDCDWYEPVKCVFDELMPLVSTGGPVIIDDYYAWEGATLATHEYLTEHKLPWPIKSAPALAGAWLIKGPERW